MSSDLLVNEVFGPVWQGEGRQAGQRCFFIRTATCNLECTWCDTPQTWVYSERKVTKHSRVLVPFEVRKEAKRMTPGEILYKLEELGATADDLIVISGGEPMLQQHALESVMALLWSLGWARQLAVETAGTIVPEDWWWDKTNLTWTVSPKMAGSGNALERRYNPEAINAFIDVEADFKFVVTDWSDMVEVSEMVDEHDIPRNRVWVMPEGIEATTVLENAKKLTTWASDSGYNLTLRQHILLYGDERQR